MAEQFIEEIYGYADIVTQLERAVSETRKYSNVLALELFNDVYERLCACCATCLQEGYERSEELSAAVLAMSKLTGNLTALSDHVARNVLPVLKDFVSSCADIDMDTEDGYRLLSSYAGYLTIEILETGRCIHSQYDPMEEARIYIENIYDPSCREYIFYGCGMGYYIYQLYKRSDGSVPITVYERDENLVTYARHYGVLDWVPEDVMRVVVCDGDEEFLAHSRKDGVRALFHFQEVDRLRPEEKEPIVEMCVALNTGIVMKDISIINYYRNLELNLPEVAQLEQPVGEEAVVVAAGPSLDASLDFLRRCKGQKTIIVVNTVFKKLLDQGIRPDFVAVLDGSPRMERHLRGVEHETVPLIVDLGVYWRWTHEYRGPKYLAYSTYTTREAEEYIKKNHKEKWFSGGTVTFFAMEFAIRAGAKKIYFVGADFGYPGEKSHASGTALQKTMDMDGMIEVEKVGGGKIQTDYVMRLYRESIEKRIDMVRDEIEFYNLSQCGSRIRGTIEQNPDACV